MSGGYERPWLYASLHLVANVAPANVALLPVPQLGNAYRLVGLWAQAEKGNAAGAVIEVHFQDGTLGAGGPDIWGAACCGSTGAGWANIVYPFPGLLMSASTLVNNPLLNIFYGSSAAGQGADVGVYYYIDYF